MPRGRPKKVKPERFIAPTIKELLKKVKPDPDPNEPPPLKYRNNPNYHWTKTKDKPSMFIFDPATFKDYPEPPTAQALANYEEWRQSHNKYGPHPNRPKTISTNPEHYLYKHGELEPRYYQLSRGAKEYIQKLARHRYYGRKDWYLTGRRQADLSKFIRALANPLIVWEDTRPQDYKDLDPILIEQGLLPRWIMSQDEIATPRVSHKFMMTPLTEQALYKVALSHGIVNWLKPQNLKVGPTVSYLLEVIGHGYLTPQNMPDNPNPALSYPRRHYKYVF